MHMHTHKKNQQNWPAKDDTIKNKSIKRENVKFHRTKNTKRLYKTQKFSNSSATDDVISGSKSSSISYCCGLLTAVCSLCSIQHHRRWMANIQWHSLLHQQRPVSNGRSQSLLQKKLWWTCSHHRGEWEEVPLETSEKYILLPNIDGKKGTMSNPFRLPDLLLLMCKSVPLMLMF